MASNPLRGVHKPGSVGLAAGPEIAIMDEEGHLLGRGITGEIVIRGDNVPRGYENNRKTNAEAFVNRRFRTGDQGVIDAEGYLIDGATEGDRQSRWRKNLTPRGRRSADGLPCCLAGRHFAVSHDKLSEDVAAAVVLREGVTATERELRAFLSGRLAAFETPRKIAFLDEIPKGATAKLQRIGPAEKLGLA